MKDNLLIVNNIKKTILYLDKIVTNFPNTEYILKDKIKKDSLEMLEFVYMANMCGGKDRNMFQKKVITKIKMIDFYLKISCDKKYISYKKYTTLGNYLIEISKSLYGLMNSEKSR